MMASVCPNCCVRRRGSYVVNTVEKKKRERRSWRDVFLTGVVVLAGVLIVLGVVSLMTILLSLSNATESDDPITSKFKHTCKIVI